MATAVEDHPRRSIFQPSALAQAGYARAAYLGD
jgi:hypothetical protein